MEDLKNVDIWDEDELGFSEETLPKSASLEQYCPPILMQSGASCVGWSACYSAISIMYNYMGDETDPFRKYALERIF